MNIFNKLKTYKNKIKRLEAEIAHKQDKLNKLQGNTKNPLLTYDEKQLLLNIERMFRCSIQFVIRHRYKLEVVLNHTFITPATSLLIDLKSEVFKHFEKLESGVVYTAEDLNIEKSKSNKKIITLSEFFAVTNKKDIEGNYELRGIRCNSQEEEKELIQAFRKRGKRLHKIIKDKTSTLFDAGIVPVYTNDMRILNSEYLNYSSLKLYLFEFDEVDLDN